VGASVVRHVNVNLRPYEHRLLTALRYLLSQPRIRLVESVMKKRRKKTNRIGAKVPQGRSNNRCVDSLFKMSKVKVTGRRKLPENDAHSRVITARRNNTLSTPGDWTDGRVSCRHSAPTFFPLFVVVYGDARYRR